MTTLNLNIHNPGHLYYRDYYNRQQVLADIGYDFKRQNEKLLSAGLIVIPSNEAVTHTFRLVTTYPGLLMGTGYTHEAKYLQSKDQKTKEAYAESFKIGFYFDHATGMPILPGSSVKGIVRSLFPNQFRVDRASAEERQKMEKLRQRNTRIIKTLFREVLGIDSFDSWDALEEEIFEEAKIEDGKIVRTKDVFFDAVPVHIAPNLQDENKNMQSRLFSADYITPHQNKENRKHDPFTNPTPIKILKVMPGVSYEFRFRLRDSVICPLLTKEKKMALFQYILMLLGAGAKTNTGYGHMTAPRSKSMPTRSGSTQEGSSSGADTPRPAEKIPIELASILLPGEYPAEVAHLTDKYILIRFQLKNLTCQLVKTRDKHPSIKSPGPVRIRINQPYQIGSPLNFKIIE